MTSTLRTHRIFAGFSLIEVLVALLVLAIGILGSAGLQLTALHSAQESSYQTAAMQLATEMAQQMQASRQAALLPEQAAHLDLDFHAGARTQTGSFAGCHGDSCTAQEFMDGHLAGWLQRLEEALPGARVRICRDAMPWNSAQARLDWECLAAPDPAMPAPAVIKIGWRSRQSAGWLPDSLPAARAASAPMVALPVALSRAATP